MDATAIKAELTRIAAIPSNKVRTLLIKRPKSLKIIYATFSLSLIHSRTMYFYQYNS